MTETWHSETTAAVSFSQHKQTSLSLRSMLLLRWMSQHCVSKTVHTFGLHYNNVKMSTNFNNIW